MNEETKMKVGAEFARSAMKNWRTCSLTALQDACDYYESAILLLISRYAMELGIGER